MDRLLEAGFAALRAPQQERHDDLVRELRNADDSVSRRLAAAIELRRYVTLGHTRVCEELLPQLTDAAPDDPPLEVATWLSDNVRGILSDDGKDPEEALIWFDRAAMYAGSTGLTREEQISRQNVVRTATRFGRADLIKTAAAYFGRIARGGTGTHEALGEIFENLGDWDAALWHYDNSERIDINAVPALGRARVYLATGMSDHATEILAQLEPVAADDIRTRSNTYVLAAIASLKTDPERSRSLALEVLAFVDSHGFGLDAPDAQLTLAECELLDGRIDSALDILGQVDSPQMLLRDRMRCLDVRAKALWTMGKPEEALAEHARLRGVWDDLDEMRSLLWETYRDLIRANRAEAEVTKLGPINEELRAASETMHVTAAQTGHDLRSGLGVIKLAMSVPLEEPMRRIARSALDQMNDIVEQVQWASTIEDSGRLNQRFGHDDSDSFDFGEVVREAVEQHRLQVEQKGQELHLSIGEGSLIVRGHRILAVQTANNLIENAMHYTPVGGSITVELVEEYGSVILDVTDSGVGVPDGDEERIFRAFVRVRQPTNGESSTGLGLYIVRSSVQQLGGLVTARARGDEPGSIFRVCLPTRR